MTAIFSESEYSLSVDRVLVLLLRLRIFFSKNSLWYISALASALWKFSQVRRKRRKRRRRRRRRREEERRKKNEEWRRRRSCRNFDGKITSQRFRQLIETVHKARCGSHRPRRNLNVLCMQRHRCLLRWSDVASVLCLTSLSSKWAIELAELPWSFPQCDPTSYFFFENLPPRQRRESTGERGGGGGVDKTNESQRIFWQYRTVP